MRICHVSPKLPPNQGANALLPVLLGRCAASRGDHVVYVAHEAGQDRPQASGPDRNFPPGLSNAVRWIPRRGAASPLARALKIDAWRTARQITAALDEVARDATFLHLHSNGLIVEVAAAWARRRGRPYVLTLYGTEIWHYKRRWPVDPFTRAYHGAAQVTFYSERLHERAVAEGHRPGLSVIYPPVSDAFSPRDEETRRAWRQSLGIRDGLVILNVKRLHELAGQRFLIDAFAQLCRHRRDISLIICGTGSLRGELERQIQTLGIADRVTLAGLVPNETIARYAAVADVFALPSLLEALPTVAIEALASGTPVISADHPGGLELQHIFGDDVTIVPRESVAPLARALGDFLDHPRRTRPSTAVQLASRFELSAVTARFDAVYRDALGGHR